MCIPDCGDSIPFIARVYRTALNSAAPAPYLVEVQRRCGSAVEFYRLYQKLVKSCAAVCVAPFDASSKVAGGLTSFAPLPLSGFAAPSLDIPSALSLCNMVESKYIDTRREASRCMLQCAKQSDLFPTSLIAGTPAMPALARASSSRSTMANAEEASAALWAALVSLLNSADAECARLGASILRATFARKSAGGLVDYLASERQLLHTLLTKIGEERETDESNPTDALMHAAFKRELAHVLSDLAQRKGSAVLQHAHPNAAALLRLYVV